MPASLGFLDLINAYDNVHLDRRHHAQTVSPFDEERLVPFRLSSDPRSPVIGILRPVIIDQLRTENESAAKNSLPVIFEIKDDSVNFSDNVNTPSSRSAAMAELCIRWRDTGLFPDLISPKKWRNEMYAVFADPFGPHEYKKDGSGNYVFEMERAACALFGIAMYGVRMSLYEGSGDDVKMWVPRRARTKTMWPGYLDNSVAGGISSGYSPLESLIKEAMEEASIEENLVRDHVKAAGAISYFFWPAAGWLQPEIQFVYDLQVPPSAERDRFQPQPLDGEVESFELMPLDEVVTRMQQGEFKPNCTLALINFLVRHGYITSDNEPNYLEIVMRLHSRFYFELC